MFLFSLLIFPILSYFIFKKFSKNKIHSNGAVKLIGITGLFLFVSLALSDIFENKESYMALISIWYISIFIYYYIIHIKGFFEEKDKIILPKFSISSSVLKGFYLFFLFILIINIGEDRDVQRALNIMRYNSEGFLHILFTFLFTFIIFSLIYEILDIIKTNVLRKVISNKEDKEKLKEELKEEILSELR